MICVELALLAARRLERLRSLSEIMARQGLAYSQPEHPFAGVVGWRDGLGVGLQVVRRFPEITPWLLAEMLATFELLDETPPVATRPAVDALGVSYANSEDGSLYSTFYGPPELFITDRQCQDQNGPWDVHNYGDEAAGTMNLLDATANSVNTIFAQLIAKVGVRNVKAMAHRLGITSSGNDFGSGLVAAAVAAA